MHMFNAIGMMIGVVGMSGMLGCAGQSEKESTRPAKISSSKTEAVDGEDGFSLRRDTAQCGILPSGGSMNRGDNIASCNGQYSLNMQWDGNLVVYGPSGPLWSSWFAKQGVVAPAGYGVTQGQVAVMQTDGNFAVWGSPDWSSETYGYSGAYLSMQDDGNLVIYRNGAPLWSSRFGNAVRWYSLMHGCFAVNGDPGIGFCIRGNKFTVRVRSTSVAGLTYRCGALWDDLRVFEDALQKKMFVFTADGRSPDTTVCEPLEGRTLPSIFVGPAYANRALPLPYLASMAQQSTNNAWMSFDEIWTSKSGTMKRVAGIPGL